MVAFLDTSAIYALANEGDPHHREARRLFSRVVDERIGLLVHNYILVESIALLHARGGWEIARRFLAAPFRFEVTWVDAEMHRLALRRFMDRRGRVSLVDEVSFLVMEEAGIRQALAFDKHFSDQGFEALSG